MYNQRREIFKNYLTNILISEWWLFDSRIESLGQCSIRYSKIVSIRTLLRRHSSMSSLRSSANACRGCRRCWGAASSVSVFKSLLAAERLEHCVVLPVIVCPRHVEHLSWRHIVKRYALHTQLDSACRYIYFGTFDVFLSALRNTNLRFMSPILCSRIPKRIIFVLRNAQTFALAPLCFDDRG